MKLLVVETATRCQSVALMDEAVLLAEKKQENCVSHVSSLVPAIQDLLTSLSCPFSAIEGLAVSAGPGSFTGLRVGLSTMIGFRAVTGLPLVTVPTLEAMAWSYRTSGRRPVTGGSGWNDSRRDEFDSPTHGPVWRRVAASPACTHGDVG